MDETSITTLQGYRDACERSYQSESEQDQVLHAAMGMSGEAGEVVDYYKKVLFHGHQLDRDKLIDETGDVLWYVAAMSLALGVSLEEIAEHNIAKLRKRYPHKFTNELSIKREE